MSKNRRKVTVEGGEKSSDDEAGSSKRSKPSVFERLGPGAAPRKSFEGERSESYKEKCRNWLKTGSCPYGPSCRFIHGPFTSGRSRRKGGDEDEDSGDEGKPRKHRSDKDKHKKKKSESLSPKRPGRGGYPRKDKDGKMKSAIVVTKHSGRGDSDMDSDDSTPWDADEDLDYKDELQLEQKRQELERVLRQLPPSEEERENITIEKKVTKQVSSSSDSSSSSSGSSSSSSSSSGSPSPPRKKSPRRPRTPPQHGRSPPNRERIPPPRECSPPPRERTLPLPRDRTPPPMRQRMTPPPRDRPTPPPRGRTPPPPNERAPRRDVTPEGIPPREKSPESSPMPQRSPPAMEWSPEKGKGHGGKLTKPGGKKKKVEKKREKMSRSPVGLPVKGKGPRTPSPSEWSSRDKERKKQFVEEKDKVHVGHKEKHKKKSKTPMVEEKVKGGGRDPSEIPIHGKQRMAPSPEIKRSEGQGRHDNGSEYESPIPKQSRRSVSPAKERTKRGKKRGRTLSVSPLRTKKLSPGPVPAPARAKDPSNSSKEGKKDKRKGSTPEEPIGQRLARLAKSPEAAVQEKPSRGRSPGQIIQQGERPRKRKNTSAEKKKRHDSPDTTPPPPVMRKRKDSPETPVKQSKKAAKGGQEVPGKRASRSKSGKRKEQRKGQKGQGGEWEPSPPEPVEKGRSRGDPEMARDRGGSPEMPPSRGRDKRRTPPPDMFEPRSRSGDSRRPMSPPPRRPESPPDGFRSGSRGSPPRFGRGGREEPGFGAGPRPPRGEGLDEFGRPLPPGPVSPRVRRSGRDAERFRDEFEPGFRDPDPEGLGLDRFPDRERDRLARYPPDIRPPLFPEGLSRLEQERRMFEIEGRFERDGGRIGPGGRESFERERFGRERFPGRPDRFEEGRSGPLGGREPRGDPRGMGRGGGPPWERAYGRGGLGPRGLSGDRYGGLPGRGRFDDEAGPERSSRRGEWERGHPDFPEDWNPALRDERRELRLGRRGEFVDIRDGRHFEDPALFHREEREDLPPGPRMRRGREEEFRERRDHGEPPYSGPGPHHDDRLDRRMDEGFERGCREDRPPDDRSARHYDREEPRPERPERRDDARKRHFEQEEERPPSPAPKRMRERSPSAPGSLRSHASNVEDVARSSEREQEKGEGRRRDRSQDVEKVKRKDKASLPESERSGKDGEKSRGRSKDAEITEDTERENNSKGKKEREKDKDPDGDKERYSEPDRRKDRKKGEDPEGEQPRNRGRKRDKDRPREIDPDRGEKRKSKDRGTEETDSSKGRERNKHERSQTRERKVEEDVEEEGTRESQKARTRDKGLVEEGDKGSEKGSIKEKGGMGREGEEEKLSESGRSRNRDRRVRERSLETESERVRRERSSRHDREKEGDRESEKGSTRGSTKSVEREMEGEIKPERRSHAGSPQRSVKNDRDGISTEVHVEKTEPVAEKYDPFEAHSDEEDVVRQHLPSINDEKRSTEERQAEEVKVKADDNSREEVCVEKRDVSPSRIPESEPDKDRERKKKILIELSEGVLTEMSHPAETEPETAEIQRVKNPDVERVKLPFTGSPTDREERRSGGGDAFSDWSSADDADDLLKMPPEEQAVPFSNQLKAAEAAGRVVSPSPASRDRWRRSPSRSSHGSRRSRPREERGERGREGRDREQGRDEKRSQSRSSSRHISQERSRDERHGFGCDDISRPGWDHPPDRHAAYDTDTNQPENVPFRADGDVDEKADLFGTSMDYETISDDGDLGQDDEDKEGVISALQIDWSSLRQDHRPMGPTGSALQRFRPAAIFAQIGVSKAYAGADLLEKIQASCRKQLDGAKAQENSTDVSEETEEKEDKAAEADSGVKPEFKLHNDIAAFHSSTVRKLEDRMNLFRNIGPFRRALCARRDLDIRRQLCNLDKISTKTSKFQPWTNTTSTHAS